jgi:tetratricopeptide (TPR) repeat protein
METRVPFIGRNRELDKIRKIIDLTQGTFVVCISGDGGIGKSRLLREIYCAQNTALKKGTTSSILDFDDLIYSNWINVQHKIAQLVSPDAFRKYFLIEDDFQKIQGSDISTETIKEFRQKVDDAFVNCFNTAAGNQRIVLYFDTTDKLKEDHEVKKNLIEIAPKLLNTVVLLAGRNASDFHKSFQAIIESEKLQLIELRPFSQEESWMYLTAKAEIRHIRIEEALIEKLIFLAEGKPILLDLAVDWRARGISLEWVIDTDISLLENLEDPKKKEWFSEFQQHLVNHVRDLKAPLDRLVLMMAHVYPLNAEMLRTVSTSETDAQALFDEAKGYSFIKTLPDDSISLHDVMRDMVNEYVWPQIPAKDDRRNWYSQKALKYFERAIHRLNNEISSLKRQTKQQKKNVDEPIALTALSEVKRQQLWVIREQLLRHSLIVNIDDGLSVLEQLYEEASTDAKISLRPQFIKLVEEKRNQLSDEQAAQLDYYRADQLFSKESDYGSARTIIDALLQKESLSSELNIKCIKLRGNIRIRQGEVDQAIKDFQKAVTLSKDNDQAVHLIMSTNGLGWAYHRKDDLEQALKYYKEARELYHSIDKQKQELLKKDYGLILNNLAVLLSANNKTREAAIGMANRAISHWEKIGNEIGLATGYQAQGVCYYRTDHTERALDAFQKALNIFEPLGLNEWIAQVLSWRGALYHNIGRNEDAKKDLNRALKIGPQHFRAMTLNRLGRANMQRQDWNTAQKCFKESLTLAEDQPDYKYWLGSVAHLINIAAKMDQVGRLKDFKNQLEECLEKIEKPDKNLEGIAYLGLAKLAFLQNADDRISLIIKLLEKGIPYIVEYGSWARTDIVTRLDLIEEDFHKTDDEIIQKVGQRMIDFIHEKEKEDLNYSTALEIMYRWANYKKEDS